jgi:hypothetical protein
MLKMAQHSFGLVNEGFNSACKALPCSSCAVTDKNCQSLPDFVVNRARVKADLYYVIFQFWLVRP